MRRERVERGIYRAERARGAGWVYEIGWYDEGGKQRWKALGTDLEEARQLRALMVENGAGGSAKYRRLRRDLFEVAAVADRFDAPTKRQILSVMKATTGAYPRKAWLRLAGLALAQARRYDPR